MLRNPTPSQIALLAATIISLVMAVLIGLVSLTSDQGFSIWAILGFAVVIFSLSYFVIYMALQRYIYRKIKLIYKTIHSQKVSKDKKRKVNMDAPIIDDVRLEVEDWAADREEEIQQLRLQETYRREFIGNVSHELKTPLFNIQGYLFTLLDGGLDDEQILKSYLERASKNVDRLNNIIEDLDMISKLEANKLELDVNTFDVFALAMEVFDGLELKAKARNIALKVKEGCNRPFAVNGDKERIRQVMVNLVSNSIKYGAEGGTTQLGLYDMDKYILIEVSDNGIGIEEKHLNRLFERFYRIDKSRSRDAGGTGLGLSIVKHLIEAHNQTIHVRSTPGLGSTFGFTLEKAA